MKQTIKHLLLATAASGLFAGATAAQSAQADAQLERAREGYAAAEWTAGPARDGFTLASLELSGFRGAELESQKGHLSRSFFAADAPEGASPAFLVEGFVGDDAAQAHELLVQWLAGLSSPKLAPRTEARGFSVGDVAFVGPSGAGPRALSWVAFTRGNVFVRVVTFDPRATPTLDLAAVSAAVDGAISSRKALQAGAAVPRPEVSSFRAAAKDVVAGDSVRLDFTAVDPAGGEPHLTWSVGGTGQGYVERRADGWHLFTTGPGEIRVTLGVTASTGTYAESHVTLVAADD
ncbi:MAG: hypothetical protein AAF682_02985 [Planctomycetota bacterium]